MYKYAFNSNTFHVLSFGLLEAVNKRINTDQIQLCYLALYSEKQI